MNKHTKWWVAGIAAAAAAAVYRQRRHLLARIMKLPPVQDSVFLQQNIPVPMPDGITLATDIFLPGHHLTDNPTVLIRTPYGKDTMTKMIAPFFAERGYAVVVQDVRGRFNSGGVFQPRVNEATDGLETLAWIAQQPWSNGRVGMFGQSYLGMVQWAAAVHNPPQLQAIAPSVTMSRGVNLFYPNGIFALEFTARWLTQVNAMHPLPDVAPPSGWQRRILGMPPLMDWALPADVWQHLPLGTLDTELVGTAVKFFQNYLHHPPEDPFWQSVNYFDHLENVTVPVHLTSGWYDFMLGDLLVDYQRLSELGRPPHLTIGHWHHFDLTYMQSMLREGLAWFDAHLRDDPSGLPPKPVQLWLMGADEWLAFDQWPPPAITQDWFLHSDGRFQPHAPAADSPPTTYIYNPANPTPTIGGAAYTPRPGPLDQRPLEARPDVVTFTSEPLVAAMDIVGPIRASLFVQSSAATTDFVVRLCVVDGDGRSINLCDGITRVQPTGDGALGIEVDLWATAQRVFAGQRLRVQVCSAAHPRWNRSTGSDEPLAEATTLQAARQTIFHDAERPSQLLIQTIRVFSHCL